MGSCQPFNLSGCKKDAHPLFEQCAALDAMHLITLAKQKFGKVSPVSPGDTSTHARLVMSFSSRPAPPLDFGTHFVGYIYECWHKSMTGLQGASEHNRVFNIFVNHLVSEVAHGYPFVCR